MADETPLYGVKMLTESLPLNESVGMRQALPSRDDLDAALDEDHERLVAGYEVLLAHYQDAIADANRWRYVRDHHAQGSSPHMDGTFYWRFTSIPAVRAQTIDEVVERAMRGEIDR